MIGRITLTGGLCLLFIISCTAEDSSKLTDSTLLSALAEAGYTSWAQAEHHISTQGPSYTQFFQQLWISTKHFGGQWNCSTHVNVVAPFENLFCWTNFCFFASALLGAYFLTKLRCWMTPLVMSWAKHHGVRKFDLIKVPECIWKGALHGLLWCMSCYVVVLSGRYSFFSQPCSVWDGVVYNEKLYTEPPPFDLQFIYCAQLMHYLHSAYATVYLDSWRSDSPALLVHHVVTLSLISLSFVRRFLRMGALVLFIHDISDVLLEFTKLNVYFKTRNGKPFPLNRRLSDLGFVAFAASWFLFRLYWYPMKVLQSSHWCVFLNVGCVDKKLFIPFNGLLWILQFLHIYWFGFIVRFLFKVLTGQLKEVEDIRETQDECEPVLSSLPEDNSPQVNGSAKRSQMSPQLNGLVHRKLNGNVK